MKRLLAYLSVGVVMLVTGLWIWKFVIPVVSSEQQVAVVPSPPPIGGAFTLTDQNGKTVTDADFRGRYMLIFFGYTFCPDVCPTAMQTVTETMDLMGPQADMIQPIFISVDPERDTPESLKSFVENFHPSLIGLTGSPEQVAAVARAYRVYYAKVKEKDAAADEYLMDHSAIMYLMGPDGKFVQYFSYGTTPEEMAKRLRKYLRVT